MHIEQVALLAVNSAPSHILNNTVPLMAHKGVFLMNVLVGLGITFQVIRLTQFNLLCLKER